MYKTLKTCVKPAILILFSVCLLSMGSESTKIAKAGLSLWFNGLLPVLFPFMVLSNLFIRLGGIESLMPYLQRVLGPLLGTSPYASYCLLVGYLFGMPMGSTTLATLLKQNKVSNNEAEWVFLYCNQLGPAFLCNFALPLLHIPCSFGILLGFYGIPLLYGRLLKLIKRREFSLKSDLFIPSKPDTAPFSKQLSLSIQSAGKTILMLGGYMIVFELLYLYEPILQKMVGYGSRLYGHVFNAHILDFLKPLFEISGGINCLKGSSPAMMLLFCSFGGLCCLAQTVYSVKDTILESHIGQFLIHRCIISALVFLYFSAYFHIFSCFSVFS